MIEATHVAGTGRAVRAARPVGGWAVGPIRAQLIASGALRPAGASELTPVPETGAPFLPIGDVLPSEGRRAERDADRELERVSRELDDEERGRARRGREEVERAHHVADL
jgi:hypothetical protein